MSELLRTLAKLRDRKDLDEREAEETVLLLAQETNAEVIGAVLSALAEKGETLSELLGAARAVLKMARPFPKTNGILLDVVGTGGDGKGTFNVSTLAALTAASAGIPVAKHGNRAASSRCGSADLLEGLGFTLEIPVEKAAVQLQKHSFTFLFAPYYHAGFKNVAAVRKKLGIRTIFNLLGPLTNPALPSIRLIGVFGAQWMDKLARVLPMVGCERAWVVHGAGGSDELDLEGENQVLFLDEGKLRKFTISPEEVGLQLRKLEEIQGGTPDQNVLKSKQTLQGEPGPLSDTVAFNAGVALFLGGNARNAREGVATAKTLLKKGLPWELVERLLPRTDHDRI